MNDRCTFPILYEYEQATLIGVRREQIANGCHPLVKPAPYDTPFDIAVKELLEKKIPLKVVRELPNGNKEIWDINELEIVHNIKR